MRGEIFRNTIKNHEFKIWVFAWLCFAMGQASTKCLNMTWVATELSLKDPFAPRLEQVACLTGKRVVVASKNNSRSRYLKSYVSIQSSSPLLANDENI